MLSDEILFQCPYCWEQQTLLVDLSVEQDSFIQDCEVCCRPIQFGVSVDHTGRATVTANHEDDC